MPMGEYGLYEGPDGDWEAFLAPIFDREVELDRPLPRKPKARRHLWLLRPEVVELPDEDVTE